MPTGRSRVEIIFFTVLIDLVGFGIVIPILPYYAQTLGAGGFGLGALFGVYSLMQFFGTSLLGRLSDRVGRRPVLLATMLINAAGYVLLAFAGTYPLLFLARAVSGFAGGNISVAQAYMADISTPAVGSRARWSWRVRSPRHCRSPTSPPRTRSSRSRSAQSTVANDRGSGSKISCAGCGIGACVRCCSSG